MSPLSNAIPTKSTSSKPAATESVNVDFSELIMAGKPTDIRLPIGSSVERRHEIGKLLRKSTPRVSHADYKTAANRPDPLDLLAKSNVGRRRDLVPLRMGRMAASPFTFLRGAACVMAWDLSKTPVSGVNVVMDGDAHVNNFGFFGTAQRQLVADLNDFDEVTIGPWEWDLKRLVASVVVAGRQNGLSKAECAEAVIRCVGGYRWGITSVESMGVFDLWYLAATPGNNPMVKNIDPKAMVIIQKAAARATQSTSATLLSNIAARDEIGNWRLKESPPVLTRVDDKTREDVIKGLQLYAKLSPADRDAMLKRYRLVDVGHRVVGVGSVGTRAYLALFIGNTDNDPLFLQIKECVAPAHAPYLPPLPKYLREHEGRRVVTGQRVLQAASDVMLGETTVGDRPFFVRQMKNMKGGVDVTGLTGEPFALYVQNCGALLARAHARGGDAAAISGYCGKSQVLDQAMATWADAYADQTERDHGSLVEAIKSGKINAITG